MSTLKELRTRIKSVKSTQKITSAMKLVASAKLRRAQDQLMAMRPYVKDFKGLLHQALLDTKDLEAQPILVCGDETLPVLVIGIASNRGLCGGYNAAIAKEMKLYGRQLTEKGRDVFFFSVGRKIADVMTSQAASLPHCITDIYLKIQDGSMPPEQLSHHVLLWLQQGLIGGVCIITGHYKSVLSQPIETYGLVPLHQEALIRDLDHPPSPIHGSVLFEPSMDIFLKDALGHFFKIYMQSCLLENNACEQAARMTAMDNASRNAKDMISKLELQYNQGRQTHITNELIEIVSGASIIGTQ